MSAMAGLKAGAGLVTMAVPHDSLSALASHLTAIMMKPVDTAAELEGWIADPRLTAFILGPGFGVGNKARDFVRLLAGRPLVLDADGISSFASDPDALFQMWAQGETRAVMTPHEGEFARLFPDLARDHTLSKVERTLKAAERSHAVVVLKGADTVIASPDGRSLINTNGTTATGHSRIWRCAGRHYRRVARPGHANI